MRKQDSGLLLPKGDCFLFLPPLLLRYDMPWWLSGKESACNAGHPVSIPGSGRFPGEGNGNPLQYSCLENPMDSGASPWGRTESDTPEWLTPAFLLRRCEQVRVQHNQGGRDRPHKVRGCRLHPAGYPVQLCVSRWAGHCGTVNLTFLTFWLPLWKASVQASLSHVVLSLGKARKKKSLG